MAERMESRSKNVVCRRGEGPTRGRVAHDPIIRLGFASTRMDALELGESRRNISRAVSPYGFGTLFAHFLNWLPCRRASTGVP